MALLGRLVRRNDLAIDVGGNRGTYAYKLWRLGAKVEVFEPNPLCFQVLSAWASAKPSVHLHSAALSNRDGSAHLHIPIDGDGTEHDASASIENAGFERARDQEVPLRTLDSYAFKQVKLIKIDVEGHEYSVIEGASETLISSKPALLVEIEQRHTTKRIDEVFEKILSFGYDGFFMLDGRLAQLSKFELAKHQSMDNFGATKGAYLNNFLFLHRDRLGAGEYRSLVDTPTGR
jgi:FkbM family methyltransferase